MPTNSANVALGHDRYLVLVENSAASRISRAQNVSIDTNIPTEQDYQIGSIDPVGSSTDPLEARVQIDQFLHGVYMEALVTSKAVSSASFTLGDVVSAACATNNGNVNIYMPVANIAAGSPPSGAFAEHSVRGAVVSSIRYSVSVGGKMGETWNFMGRDYRHLSPAAHDWSTGAFLSTGAAPSSIKAKEVVLYVGGSASANTMFRVQSLDLAVDFPITPIMEIGNRTVTGHFIGAPRVQLSFDVLETDTQVDALFAQLTGGGYDYNYQVSSAPALYVVVFRETSTRAATFGQAETLSQAIKSFKLESVRVTGQGVRVSINNRGMKRYQLLSDKTSTAGTGGLIIYPGQPA